MTICFCLRKSAKLLSNELKHGHLMLHTISSVLFTPCHCECHLTVSTSVVNMPAHCHITIIYVFTIMTPPPSQSFINDYDDSFLHDENEIVAAPVRTPRSLLIRVCSDYLFTSFSPVSW